MTRVSNSRPQKRLHQTWRRRTCTHCSAIFTTIEVVDLGTSLAVKHPGGHVRPFSRDKLFMSICRSVGHRKTPIEDAAALTATVITALMHQAESGALRPESIVNSTLQVLQRYDNVAAIQYGAYHKT